MTAERANKEAKDTKSHQKEVKADTTENPVPFDLNNASVTDLQRVVGNRAIQRLLAQRKVSPLPGGIRPKLTVGAPDDQYEQEADAVAQQIMTMPDPVRRDPIKEDDEDEPFVQTRLVQRQSSTADTPEVTDNIENNIESMRGGGQSLPDSAQNFFESRFEQDFSSVNIHTGNEAHSLNESLQARAFTTGSDIFFREGEYDPNSSSGRELLAHELTHVVQQGGSQVRRQEMPPDTTAPTPDPAILAQAEQMFDEAMRLYEGGEYRQAIITFERVRQLPGMTDEIKRDCLYNIGMSNLRLRRFATAALYFEEYLTMPDANAADGQRQLEAARTGRSGSPDAPVLTLEEAERLFDEAMRLYESGEYRQAIITFEQVREVQDMPDEVKRDCLYNIGMSNLRLRRFATATIYFEEYLMMPGADTENGTRHLEEARQGAGTSTTATTSDTSTTITTSDTTTATPPP